MSTLLPITQRRLQQFKQRRQWLLMARGLSGAIIAMLAAGILVAAMDAWWVFPTAARWMIAMTIYLAMAFLIGWLVIRPWVQRRSWRSIADLMEQREPHLKDRLRAALELADDMEGEAGYQKRGQLSQRELDSPAFRQALQQSVARRLESLDIGKLLPWQLIQTWFSVAILLLGIIGTLCLIPNLFMAQRLGRVLLPMVDFGRLSRYSVEALQPDASQPYIPENDVILFEAMVHGGQPSAVWLEAIGPDGSQAPRVPMARGPIRDDGSREQESYQAHWTPAIGVSRYRIVADDAATPWKRLETYPRPKVEGFELEYHYPSYAQEPDEKRVADSGDLEALAGSKVTLMVRPNQTLVHGQVQLQFKGRPALAEAAQTSIPFELLGDGRLAAEIPIERDGTYHIELTSAKTGFTNSFSPGYKLHAIADQPPKIRWQMPEEPSLAVKPNEMLEMSVMVEDELPIAKLIQQVKKGSPDWSDVERSPSMAAEGVVNFSLDLLPWEVQPGDLVQTRMVAVDRLGQTTMTPVVDLFISSLSLDPKRQAGMRDKIAIAEQFAEAQLQWEELRHHARTAVASDPSNPANATFKTDGLDALRRWQEAAREQSGNIRQNILSILPRLDDSVSATELEQLAMSLANLETVHLSTLEYQLDNLATKEVSPDLLAAPLEGIDQFLAQSSRLVRRARDFASHDILSQVGQDLKVLHSYQQELKESVKSIQPESYRRRQALVARQMHDLADLIREQIPILREQSERGATQRADWLESLASKITEITGRNGETGPTRETPAERQQLADRVENELRQHLSIHSIDNELPQELLRGRNELRQRSGTAASIIQGLQKQVSRLENPQDQLAADAELARQYLPPLEQLTIRRGLQQTRHDGDSAFIADLGESYRAVQTILEQRHGDPRKAADQLQQLGKAMATLEGIHQLEEASRMLDQLHETERWHGSSLDAQFEQPRVWEAYQDGMKRALETLAASSLDRAALRSLSDLMKGEAAQRVGGKIDPRRWSSAPMTSAAHDLEVLRSALGEATKPIDQLANQARQVLKELTPSIPQLARHAAKRVAESGQDAEELSQALADGEVPDPQPRIHQWQDGVEANDPHFSQLIEALADLASRQTLLNAQQANIARDADAAITITHDARQRVQQSMEVLHDAVEPVEWIEGLDQSVAIHRHATNSLEQIARHFEGDNQRGDAGQVPSPEEGEMPRSELAERARELAKQPDMERAHADAERLRQLATLDPKRVLQQLEKELARNQPMRHELANIAEEAVQATLKVLDHSADREHQMRVELENSDPRFALRKGDLLANIKRMTKAGRQIADYLAPRVQSTSERAQVPEVRKAVQQMRDEIYRSAEKAEKLAEGTPIDQMLSAANALHASLDVFGRRMQRQALTLEQAQENVITLDTTQLKARQREMEDWQSRFRDEDIRQAFAAERDLQQEGKQLESLQKKIQKDLQEADANLERARAELKKRPADNARLEQVEKAQREVAHTNLIQEQALSLDKDHQSRVEKARSRREEIQLRMPKPVTAINPHAELGSRVAVEAAEAASLAAQQLADSLTAFRGESTEGPQASRNSLDQSIHDQEELVQSTRDAAETLARASRHEQRLTRPEEFAKLAEHSKQVAEIVEGPMAEAARQLTVAQAAAATSPPNEERSSTRSESTRQSQAALTAAEQALRDQATALASAVAQQKVNPSESDRSERQSDPREKGNALLSPQEMAQMLDELDQLLSAAEKNGDKQAPGAQKSARSNSTSGQQSKSGAPGEPSDSAADQRAQTLAEAADKLAAEMNQQRQAMESGAKNMPESGASDSQSRSATNPGRSSAGIVLPVEIQNWEDWGKLREQSAENTLEGAREEMLPAFRPLIEEYFRVLSKRPPAPQP